MRRNRSQTAKRRSHHALVQKHLAKCECGALRVPHRACRECGKYNGRVIIDVVARAKREQRRAKRRSAETGETEKQQEKKEESTVQA